jgi:hypothetical protein
VIHLADPPPPAPSTEPELEPPSEAARRPMPPDVSDDHNLDLHDTDRERARELFQEGAEAYQQSDWPRARQAFQAAYDLVPERALLFNIASAELRMQDLVSACGHFRQYIAEGDPTDPRAQQVQSQVASRCNGIP